ncbi:protein-S-isoprenylcysteine O-methyltransferase Ste14 [Methanohalophilus levihalophilus]|nr:isoprenylcysteine carboxylmethyltransferase family protein [Methanohalophilus levihalophilus]MBP2030287.1 protein-S-isoprenylcysteine O-methyltransferase Ste14 [Methanohalophilus levihalophilus]
MVLSIIIFVLIAFAVIHSIMASLPFKRMVRRVVGVKADKYYRHIYNIVTVIILSPLAYLLYNNPGPYLYVVESPWRWLMVGVQLIGAYIGARALMDARNRFEFRGQLASPGTPDAGHMDVVGVYKWIRDPFLLSGLMIIWFTPFMTTNLLALFLVTTVYLIFGSVHTEMRLVSQFGDEYRDYQKRVRRIIPTFGN